MLVTMHQAKTRLSELVERAVAGEEIIIARDDRAMVRLAPVGEPSHPQSGAMAAELAPMTMDRFAPWSDAELDKMGFGAFTVPGRDEPA